MKFIPIIREPIGEIGAQILANRAAAEALAKAIAEDKEPFYKGVEFRIPASDTHPEMIFTAQIVRSY